MCRQSNGFALTKMFRKGGRLIQYDDVKNPKSIPIEHRSFDKQLVLKNQVEVF